MSSTFSLNHILRTGAVGRFRTDIPLITSEAIFLSHPLRLNVGRTNKNSHRNRYKDYCYKFYLEKLRISLEPRQGFAPCYLGYESSASLSMLTRLRLRILNFWNVVIITFRFGSSTRINFVWKLFLRPMKLKEQLPAFFQR